MFIVKGFQDLIISVDIETLGMDIIGSLPRLELQSVQHDCFIISFKNHNFPIKNWHRLDSNQ